MKNQNIADIITAAAGSPLGIFALMLVAISLIALFYFNKSTDKIKLMVFFVMLSGVMVFGYQVSILQNPDSNTASSAPTTTPQLDATPIPEETQINLDEFNDIHIGLAIMLEGMQGQPFDVKLYNRTPTFGIFGNIIAEIHERERIIVLEKHTTRVKRYYWLKVEKSISGSTIRGWIPWGVTTFRTLSVLAN